MMKTLFTILAVFSAFAVYAQPQSGLISQNLQQLNAASAGTNDDIGFKSGVSFYSNYSNTPKMAYYASSGHKLESLNSNLGFAMTLGRDEYSSSNIISGNYNYKLALKNHSSIRIGASYRYEELKVEGHFGNDWRGSWYKPIDYKSASLDPAVMYVNDSNGFFAGVATSGLVKIKEINAIKPSPYASSHLPLAEMSYMVGKMMRINKTLDIRPVAVVIHTIPDAEASGISFNTVNLSNDFIYKNKLSVGFNYYTPVRYPDDFSGYLFANAGYWFTKDIRFAVSHMLTGYGLDRKNLEVMVSTRL